MRITITGAAGILGQKQTASLIACSDIGINTLDLHDFVSAQKPDKDIPKRCLSGSNVEPAQINRQVAARPDVICQRAVIVSDDAERDVDSLDARRSLSLTGVSCTTAQQIEATVRRAGAETANLINYNPDPEIEAQVSQWPKNSNASQACAMGFSAAAGFDNIIRVYLADDCNPQRTL
jgi:hypothetical protein